MENFIQPGKTIAVTGPSGGVVAGQGFFVGSLFVVASAAIAQSATGQAETEGVFSLPKATGVAFSAGDLAPWDVTAAQVDSQSADAADRICGVVVEAAGSSATTVKVAINKGSQPTRAVGGQYVQVAGDDTAGTVDIATGLTNILGFSVTLTSTAGVVNASDAVVTKSGGDITVADGSTYALTAGHIVNWVAVGW